MTRRQFLKRTTLGGLAVGFGDAFFYEPHALIFEQSEIPIRGLAKEFDGYRIALLSDFHLPKKASLDLVRHGFELAYDFRPDLIALPGDFTDRQETGIPNFRPYFGDLKVPDAIVGTLGNHDHRIDPNRVRRGLATETPIRLIENDHILLRRGKSELAIGGVGDLWHGVVDVERAFAGVSKQTPRVLLSHNPDFAEDMLAPTRVDLQLSGHTHGGEVRFPYGKAPFIPSKYGNKFRAGLCEGLRHRVYVTRGISTLSHFRLCCRPEVTGIILRTA